MRQTIKFGKIRANQDPDKVNSNYYGIHFGVRKNLVRYGACH